MTNKEKRALWIWIAVLAIIGIGLNYWAGKNDAKQDEMAQRYEACVQREYGTHPVAYYQDNGVYPVCED